MVVTTFYIFVLAIISSPSFGNYICVFKRLTFYGNRLVKINLHILN